ncbi:MAG: hypothetical protein H7Y31_03980 [Chitinophagaceae bacterium]|nr:hypothetical protein [Chitinophagaceae bacterium]
MKKILFVLAISFFAVGVAHAQKPEVVINNKDGWQKIGEAKVDFKTEKDQFIIMGADKFKSIQIRVKDAPIHLEDLKIEYDGGTADQSVALRTNFAAGSKSKIIDLKDHTKGLKKVSFVYRTVQNSADEKAEIELWGLK